MERRLSGLVLLIVGVLALLQVTGIYNFGLSFWPVLLVLAGGIMVWRSLWRGIAWFMLVLGLWVAGMGLAEILFNATVVRIRAVDVLNCGWPLLLVALGLTVIFGPRRFAAGHCFPFHVRDWRGRPTHGEGRCRVGDLYHGRMPWVLEGNIDIKHSVGDVVLDLSTAEISPGGHRVSIRVGAGELLVRVPHHVNVKAGGSLGIGELTVLGEKQSGFLGLSLQGESVVEGAVADLEIDAKVGVGELTIETAAAFSAAGQ